LYQGIGAGATPTWGLGCPGATWDYGTSNWLHDGILFGQDAGPGQSTWFTSSVDAPPSTGLDGQVNWNTTARTFGGAWAFRYMTASGSPPVPSGSPVANCPFETLSAQTYSVTYQSATSASSFVLYAGTITGCFSAYGSAYGVSIPSPMVFVDLTGAIVANSTAQLPTIANLLSVANQMVAYSGINPGQTWQVRFINESSTYTWTVINATDSHWTLNGNMVIQPGCWSDFVITMTSATTASIQFVGSNYRPPSAQTQEPINTQTASYVLQLSDLDGMVLMNCTGANNLTVPPNSSVAFPLGARVDLAQTGVGQTTVVAGAGVTINTAPGLIFRAQYSGASLIQTAANVWLLVGDLT